MKVLIFSQYFWPESFHINDVAKSLSENGVEIEVLTGKPNYPLGCIFEGYRAFGCQTEMHEHLRINRIPIIPRNKGGLGLAINYLSFVISGVFFAIWMLRKRDFDVIFVPGYSPILQALPAILLGWLRSRPVLLWVQDLWPDSLLATGYVRSPLILLIVKSLVRFIYSRVDLLLVQSEAFIAPVSALASNTPVRYYPNSVETAFSTLPTVIAPDVPGVGEAFSVMFAGNIGSAQAVEVIVEAATLLRDKPGIQFVVLGDGSRRDWMRQESKKRNLSNLHIPGRFPVETMPSLMQKSSLLLVSLADKEIFASTVPNKIQAYMASGRPIIACMRGEGARLVVKSGAGLAVPPEDPVALADCVLSFYDMSSTEREQMGLRGRNYFCSHFDHNQLIQQLIGHLETLTQQSRDAS